MVLYLMLFIFTCDAQSVVNQLGLNRNQEILGSLVVKWKKSTIENFTFPADTFFSSLSLNMDGMEEESVAGSI